MKPSTRESTRERMISIVALVLVISIGFLVTNAAALSDKYPKMAPVDQYLMERNAETLLARSAAPDSISSDATVCMLMPGLVEQFSCSLKLSSSVSVEKASMLCRDETGAVVQGMVRQPRVQYAYFEGPKATQTILRHPK